MSERLVEARCQPSLPKNWRTSDGESSRHPSSKNRFPATYQLSPFGAGAAVLEIRRLAPETAAAQFERGARLAAAVLGLDRQRAAQGVEPEQRIRPRHQRGLGDGDARDQVPTHHVAKRLIEAHAIHVDREALRRAEQRRGGVAAVVHVGLEGVALHFIHVHAVEAPVHRVRM